MRLVVDAGPLIAAASLRDANHERCVGVLRAASQPIVVPQLVVGEVAYMLGRHVGHRAEHAFATSFRLGELIAEPVEPSDWERIEQLVEQYRDLSLGIVDASVVVTCERLGLTRLATLDHRHFSVIRPSHCDVLELVP